jgi:hypothetical protein
LASTTLIDAGEVGHCANDGVVHKVEEVVNRASFAVSAPFRAED